MLFFPPLFLLWGALLDSMPTPIKVMCKWREDAISLTSSIDYYSQAVLTFTLISLSFFSEFHSTNDHFIIHHITVSFSKTLLPLHYKPHTPYSKKSESKSVNHEKNKTLHRDIFSHNLPKILSSLGKKKCFFPPPFFLLLECVGWHPGSSHVLIE